MAAPTAGVEQMKKVRELLADIDGLEGIVAYTDFCIHAIENSPFKALANRTEWIIPPRPAAKPEAAKPQPADAKPS